MAPDRSGVDYPNPDPCRHDRRRMRNVVFVAHQQLQRVRSRRQRDCPLGLAGAKVEAELSFPAQVKQALSDWRVGSPITIDDREVQVVQGRTGAGRPPVKLYFAADSGLLVRLVRYTDTPVGRIPTQIDYADYRDVSGIKMAFKWTTTWTDGRSVTELSSVQANVPIDAATFAQPARPAPPAKK